MEFWGAEVKAGTTFTTKPEKDSLIHISHATLELKGKQTEHVALFVKVDGKKILFGNILPKRIPQLFLDMVFEKEFELSHSSILGSVHFVGYQSPNIEVVVPPTGTSGSAFAEDDGSNEDSDNSSDDEEEDTQIEEEEKATPDHNEVDADNKKRESDSAEPLAKKKAKVVAETEASEKTDDI